MSIKRFFSPIVVVLILLIIFSGYMYWPKDKIKQQKKGRGAVQVVVAQVKRQTLPVTIEALGTARANESVEISVQQTDVVQNINFDDGQVVKKGQLLLTLNSREEKARVNELNINLNEARRQLKRVSNLARENVASIQLLDEQQARVKALKAQLEVAQSRLAELDVLAPFSGQLGLRQVSIGALLKPGDVITTLDDLLQVKLDFSVAEQHLASLKLGQTLNAESVAYPGRLFVGEVVSIDPRIDPVARSIQVRAIINNPDLALRPGMLLQIELQKKLHSSLTLPESAIVPVNDEHFVYVVDGNNQVQRKPVTVGDRKPGLVVIASGLQEGETVVTQGTIKLKPGAKVDVTTEDKGRE